MEFRILGPLEVEGPGGPVELGSTKVRSLLGLLLIRAGEVVSAERLIDDLWDGAPPRSAAGTLQTYVSQLRKQLGPAVVQSMPGGYRVSLADHTLDAARFATVLDDVARNETADPSLIAARLRDALELWRGQALSDFVGAHWAAAEAARLEGLRQLATEDLVEARLALGEHARLVPELEGLVKEHPLRERLWGQWMLALYRCGRQAEALRAYGRLRAHLVEELGIEPSAEVAELEQAILLQKPELDWQRSLVIAPSAAEPLVGLPTGTVTLVMSDIEGSTRLWEEHAADMRAALVRHDELMNAALADAGGYVFKTVGDGFCVAFASAATALVGAIAAQRAIADEPWPADVPLRVRIALHSGECSERDGDYFGPAVNRVARLAAIAHGGQTLTSATTAALLAGHTEADVALRDLGEHRLKDLTTPEHVFQIDIDGLPDQFPPLRSRERAAAVAPSVPVPLVVAAGSALTGRHEELAALHSAWIQACAPATDRPRPVVMVSGEPGIGKTRLVAELARSVAGAGGYVYYGRCDENSADPFLPWLAVLGGLIAEAPTEVLEEVREDAAELQRLCPQVAKRLDLPPAQVAGLDSERARLFSATERIVVSVSERAPILVVVDDLHWADRSSLLLLTHLASADVRGRFLLVGTYRDTELERSHPLSTALADLRRDRRLQRVTLRGLDLQATAKLIQSRAGHEPDAALAAAVFAETEGHPFFVEEVCAYLIETGGVHVRNARLTAGEDLGRTGIPEGVRDVLGRRFERLSPEAMETLRLGAVMGRVLGVVVLEKLRPDAESVLDALEEASRAGLVRECEDAFGMYEFCHALVRSALVEEISSMRRVRLHRSIADAIERTRPELTAADLDLLAYHYAEAAADGDVTKAVEYACRGAQESIGRAAFDEARGYLDRGFEIVALAQVDTAAADAALLLASAELLTLTTSWNDAAQVAVRAADRARAASLPELFGRAVVARSAVASGPAVDAELDRLIHEALQMLGDNDYALQIQLRCCELFHRVWLWNAESGDPSLSAELISEARGTGDWKAVCLALTVRCYLLRLEANVAEQRELGTEIVELATTNRDLFFTLMGHQVLACAGLGMGDAVCFTDNAQALARGADGLGISPWAMWGAITQTTQAVIAGRLGEADEQLRAFRVAHPAHLDAFTGQLFWIRAEQGRLDEIAHRVDALEAFADMTMVMPMLALARARAGRNPEARAWLERATVNDFAALPRDSFRPVALAWLAETAVLVADHDMFTPLYQELEPYAGQILVASWSVVCAGAADRYLGMLDAALGRTERARQRFAAAYDLEARHPAPPLMARTQFWHGMALATRPEHLAEARRALDECAETATSLGMHELADQAKARRDA